MPAHRTRDTQVPRSLEVKTDSPQPPTLSIITPTPRAFTFPMNHAIHDSPYSTPSSSPFEPDLGCLALTSPTEIGSPSSPMTHKRRKSASSTSDMIEQRRPKKGDEDYVKRPENAFILFRRKCCEERQAAHDQAAAADAPTKKQRQADLSKTISQQWKSLPAEERQYWEDLAKEKKKEHEALHPDYVYRPQRAKGKEGKMKGRKLGFDGIKREYETDNESSVSFVLPLTAPMSRHGRSASAPTPPLGFQQIVVPNLYHPSCPASPSLIPRRASHPAHPDSSRFDESTSHFDFMPNDMPPPSFPPDYSPEFYQNMFNVRPTLHPLALPVQHHLMSPADSIASSLVSPSSSTSSGPPSPHSDLYVSQQLQHLPPPQPNSATELLLPDFDFANYAWEQDMWTNAGDGLLMEGFDLDSIPPIELGLSKGDEVQDDVNNALFVDAPQGCYARHESLEGLFDFEDMMASNGF